MQTAQRLKTTKDLLVIPEQDFKVYELLEGEVFVSEHPSLKHQKVLGNLVIHFENYIWRNPVGNF